MKISIITVCKNSEMFLNETISSVIGQRYKNIEYIIIDGKSSDSTVDVIKQYTSYIHYWISEPDNGMYDAINKGLAVATGDYILVLNSDDVLADEYVLENVAEKIGGQQLDYYYGNIIKVKDGECKKVRLFDVNFKQLLMSTHGTFVPHPCFFISSGLNKILGGYDLTYKFASDYDYILRALASGARGKYIDIFMSKFRIHANSITASGKIEEERKKILKKHGYYQSSYISRKWFYYTLWIYYKIKNITEKYTAG